MKKMSELEKAMYLLRVHANSVGTVILSGIDKKIHNEKN